MTGQVGYVEWMARNQSNGGVIRRSRQQQNLRNIERMRQNIPAARYLSMLDMAIMTGKLPRFKTDGSFANKFDNLNGKQRIELMGKLIDKAIPNNPLPAEALGPELPTPEELNALSQEELDEIPQERLVELRQALAEPQQDDLPHGMRAAEDRYDIDGAAQAVIKEEALDDLMEPDDG